MAAPSRDGGDNAIRINYTASPTGARFHASNARVRGLMGPVGSGKSVTCVMETLRIGSLQARARDGLRHTRWGVFRNTYGELKSTTIKTFEQWIPGPICPIVYDAPIRAVLTLNDLVVEYLFASLDRPDQVKKLLSLELTGAWLNEAREMPREALDMLDMRIGRFPPESADGYGCTRDCIIMDTNPPDTDHWWYKLAEVERPAGHEFFSQPGGIIRKTLKSGKVVYLPNPKAENIAHLKRGHGYYLEKVEGKRLQWINVYMLGQYGSVQEGRPCYPEYNDEVHASKTPLAPVRGIPLRLGWDYGRTPACIIGQLMPNGQLRILKELVVDATGPGMAVRTFATNHVVPFLKAHYEGYELRSRGDPSGSAGGQAEENSCEDVLRECGIPTTGANTNLIEPRLDNVVWFLSRFVEKGQPALLVDSINAPTVRQGFLGKYQMGRVQVAGETRYKDQPIKNAYSHPHDAVQYLAEDARQLNVTSKTAVRPVAPAVRYAT